MERAVDLNPGKYILGMFPHFLFQQMLDLFGFDNLMVALLRERAAVDTVADRLTESCLHMVDCFADRGADGMIAIEDLGLQHRLMIAPPLWREVYRPRMQAIVRKCHDRGIHFFIHSCGDIREVIEDFISIGVDVLQIDQQENMGIDGLASRYAGRICFFCPVDIQATLPVGPPERIVASAKHLMRAFGSANGGFMAKTYPQPEAISIPEEHTRIMCDAFKTFGSYPLQF
jgi:uroporphyrinogen-III decarboxylase